MSRQTIWLYLIFSFVTKLSFSFMAATYVIFLTSQGELDLFQVNLVNLAFFSVIFLSEIPTGIVADVFGRKFSFVISCFVMSLGMFLYGISDSFTEFIIAEIVIGVGSTFSSGAFDAWMVDRLKHFNYRKSLTPIFARQQWFGHAAGIIGALIGAYLFDFQMTLPWMAGGVGLFIAGILASILMREEYFVRKKISLKNDLKKMKNIFQKSTVYVFKNKVVRFIVVLGVIQAFGVQALNMQWQPFFSEFITRNSYLGWISTGISVCLLIGSLLAPRFLKLLKSNEKLALIVSQLLLGLGVVIAVISHSFLIALAAFFAHEVARGLFRPLKDAYLNDNIPKTERATLISFDSMARCLGVVPGLLLSGLIAKEMSISASWIFSAVVLILVTLLLARNGHALKMKRSN